jgi:hypothetical protein
LLASSLDAELIGLPKERLDLLYTACADHTEGRTSEDPTIRRLIAPLPPVLNLASDPKSAGVRRAYPGRIERGTRA